MLFRSYLEPFSTLDVDVFVELHASQGSLVVDPTPIFQYLRDQGCVMEGQYVVVADSPVQFIPPGNPLAEEALNDAVEKDVQGTPARVFTAEHLAALALQVGRVNDKLRLMQFIQAEKLDIQRFETIVQRHQLGEQWREFQQQFLKK